MKTRPANSSAGSLNRSAAFASIAVALLLVGMKLWAVLQTGSTAMLGSLADTVLDLVASLATLAGVWVAAQPEDRNHRFGHDKAEALAALFQVTLISISALILALRSFQQFLAHAKTEAAGDGILVSAIALAATFAAHLASLLIGDMMMSKVTWRRWCTRVAVAGVLLAAVLGVAALYTGTWLDVVKAAFARG